MKKYTYTFLWDETIKKATSLKRFTIYKRHAEPHLSIDANVWPWQNRLRLLHEQSWIFKRDSWIVHEIFRSFARGGTMMCYRSGKTVMKFYLIHERSWIFKRESQIVHEKFCQGGEANRNTWRERRKDTELHLLQTWGWFFPFRFTIRFSLLLWETK